MHDMHRYITFRNLAFGCFLKCTSEEAVQQQIQGKDKITQTLFRPAGREDCSYF